MQLAPCRSCEVLLPVSVQVCPWCKTERPKRGPARLIAASLLLALGVAVGWGASRGERGAGSAVAASGAPRQETGVTIGAPSPVSSPEPTMPDRPSIVADSMADALRPDSAVAPLAVPASSVVETRPRITAPEPAISQVASASSPPVPVPSVVAGWRPATPVTWINVRSAARVDAPVLRVVNPSETVQVGPPIAGWRPVRGTGFSGWAGARHFAVATP